MESIVAPYKRSYKEIYTLLDIHIQEEIYKGYKGIEIHRKYIGIHWK